MIGVSRSGYYAWRHRPASARAQANACLLERMTPLHRETKERYGAAKLWRALRAAGVNCGRHRVARLRQVHGLEARRTRQFRVVLEQHRFAPPAPNQLQQIFGAPAPNRIWVSDLTAIVTRADWIYLAVIPDLDSRHVIGWTMSPQPDQQAALTALQMALTHRRPQSGLIHHTNEPRGGVHERGLPTAAAANRAGRQHQSQRQLLRQCGGGELLQHLEE